MTVAGSVDLDDGQPAPAGGTDVEATESARLFGEQAAANPRGPPGVAVNPGTAHQLEGRHSVGDHLKIVVVPRRIERR